VPGATEGTTLVPGSAEPALPSAPASASSGPGPSGAPEASPPPLEASPVADLDPAVAAGLGAALIAILLVTVLVLRRGRSGVGL
jgi:hypothetical protein